jgi:hypothetical protein
MVPILTPSVVEAAMWEWQDATHALATGLRPVMAKC